MADLLHHLLFDSAARVPGHPAIVHDGQGSLDYRTLAALTRRAAAGFRALGAGRHDRIGIWLPKQQETVVAMLAASVADAVFVPINSLLKPDQVRHIVRDCDVKVIVTSLERAQLLHDVLADCPSISQVVVTGRLPPGTELPPRWCAWDTLLAHHGEAGVPPGPTVDHDMVAILYTSGSTGRPKGVIISHRNIVTGARSVSEYLGIGGDDRLLAVLPFSFDYGLNQLTSSLLHGATCVLMDYLLPRDVVRAVARHRITGLGAVPPLWAQLAPLDWPPAAVASLRYITNSGGHMPENTLRTLREKLPGTRPFLMYGLTEAFRSTYLPPEKIDERQGSIGRAIPNAEILVVNAQGQPCGPNEPGELVHRGALVTLGYWNDPERTAERFRPVPNPLAGIPTTELAVWSGDTVRMDEDGYLYFVGRTDGMLKTSGYRVSPEEVEEALYGTGLVTEAAAVGVAHETLGQSIVAVVSPLAGVDLDVDRLLEACRQHLPNYMVPATVLVRDHLPHTPNGKIDRKLLAAELAELQA